MNNLSSWIVIRRLRLPFLVIILTFSVSILGMVLIPGQDDQGHVYHLNFFDAFYFVSYMASTIGFGESPYAFTYPQKLWVSFSIYMTVIGWFYGIGSIIALVQDDVLHKELEKNRFLKAVKRMKEPFVLILGYNTVTRALIKKLNLMGIRMVVLDRDQQSIDALMLENYSPQIPAYCTDVMDPGTLEMAGIRKKNCQSVVVLFEDEQKNSKLALMCKHLNKRLELIARSSSLQNSEFLKTMGVDHIINPFKVISSRLYTALRAPHLWLLEMWIYGHLLKVREKEVLPEGHYVIYGYGRMGKALEKGLEKAGMSYSFIDARLSSDGGFLPEGELCGEDEIEEKLLAAGIGNASVIIAGTRDDLVNIAVIALAKKYNPDIYVISRENEISDIKIFKAARVNRHYVLEEIIIDKAYHYLAMPLANMFIGLLNRQNEEWGRKLVDRIVLKMGENPGICEIDIEQEQAYAACMQLQKGTAITLGMLKRKREDWRLENQLLFLMLVRSEEPILLPSDDVELAIGDKLLVICHDASKEDLEYILQNYYVLHYAMYGKEKMTGILNMVLPDA